MDVIVRRNIDHLFGISTPAAAMDAKWAFLALKFAPKRRSNDYSWVYAEPGGLDSASRKDRVRYNASVKGVFPFNSGIIVLSPDREVHQAMRREAAATKSYDGGDQGFLAAFFASRNQPWYELPRRYHQAWCVQPDEARNAYIWHVFGRRPYLNIEGLDTAVDRVLRGGEAGMAVERTR
mmetsp:Transcript_38501/g.121312  ORF Transcript_38501/g.121312 Transcript_38501/m.121312 type:complete len:179 (+) Transcript_38501:288-824(+)